MYFKLQTSFSFIEVSPFYFTHLFNPKKNCKHDIQTDHNLIFDILKL